MAVSCWHLFAKGQNTCDVRDRAFQMHFVSTNSLQSKLYDLFYTISTKHAQGNNKIQQPVLNISKYTDVSRKLKSAAAAVIVLTRFCIFTIPHVPTRGRYKLNSRLYNRDWVSLSPPSQFSSMAYNMRFNRLPLLQVFEVDHAHIIGMSMSGSLSAPLHNLINTGKIMCHCEKSICA